MTEISDLPANAAGYAVGLACSFALNKRRTFRHDGDLMLALMRFFGVLLVAYLINVAAVLLLISAGTNDNLAHLVGMPLYTGVFYLGCRYFAFASWSVPRP